MNTRERVKSLLFVTLAALAIVRAVSASSEARGTGGPYYPNVGSCPEAWVPVPAS